MVLRIEAAGPVGSGADTRDMFAKTTATTTLKPPVYFPLGRGFGGGERGAASALQTVVAGRAPRCGSNASAWSTEQLTLQPNCKKM